MKLWIYFLDDTLRSASHLAVASFIFLMMSAAFLIFGTWSGYRAAETKERLNNERAKQLALQLATQQERAALAEQRLLGEQRGSASDRWRLERIEKAVLPRQLTEVQRSKLLSQLKGLGPINIAVSKTEASGYGFQLIQLFKEAQISRQVFLIPQGTSIGVTVYVANSAGEKLASVLHEQNIASGEIRGHVMPVGLEELPPGQNAVIIGENDGALRGGDGQPGEGIDEHGYPIPEPKP